MAFTVTVNGVFTVFVPSVAFSVNENGDPLVPLSVPERVQVFPVVPLIHVPPKPEGTDPLALQVTVPLKLLAVTV